jgi:hypothetical protein
MNFPESPAENLCSGKWLIIINYSLNQSWESTKRLALTS